MARLIQTEIKRVLADEILFGRLRDGGKVEIDAPDGALVFRYAVDADRPGAPAVDATGIADAGETPAGARGASGPKAPESEDG
jgi:hypothetical protein